MSFWSALAVTFVRSTCVAFAAAVAARGVNRLLTESQGTVRWTCGILLAIPWLIPGLLVGYAWNGWVFAVHGWSVRSGVPGLAAVAELAVRHDRICNELLLWCLQFSRCLPWAVMMLRWGVRVEESETGWFLRGLAASGARIAGWSHDASPVRRLHREWQRLAPAAGLAFITCFQEFELVARLGRPSWTVWLIDAQATGVAVSGLLVRATIAAVLQTVLIGGMLPVRQGLFSAGLAGPVEARGIGWLRVPVWAMLLLGTVAAVAVPAGRLAPGFIHGIAALTGRWPVLRRLVGEVTVGLAVAVVAATVAIALAKFLEISPTHRGMNRLGPIRSHLPGRGGLGTVQASMHWCLFWLGAWGAIPLCLLTLCGLAAARLTYLNQTLFPWCLVQSLWLFPRAVCLMSLVRAWRQPQSAYLGTILSHAPDADRRQSAHQLWWRENWRNPVMAGLFLAMTAYFDLPTGQLLAPAGLASAPVTLYTQMHYGRNALLTAMTLLAVAIPWTLALLILNVLPRLTIWRRSRSIPPGVWSRSR